MQTQNAPCALENRAGIRSKINPNANGKEGSADPLGSSSDPLQDPTILWQRSQPPILEEGKKGNTNHQI
eukprot:9075546-Pyramimonas_sp.AAC.1